MRWSPQYHNCCSLQKKILAMAEGKSISPSQMASLVSSYDRLEERKRVIRMVPKPRDVEVQKKSKPKPSATFVE